MDERMSDYKWNMGREKLHLFSVLFSLLVHPTAINAEACPSLDGEHTVCEMARAAVAAVAPSLPQRISENMTITNMVSIENYISTTVRLNYSEDFLNTRLRDVNVQRQVVDDAMWAHTKNMVCSSNDLAPFVVAGGVVGYVYLFNDGVVYLQIEIDVCN
jgi:hypothetical protein